MNKTEQNKQAAATDEDWAIIPFDEAEDVRRWAKLIEETDELIAQNERLDAALAASPRQNKIPCRTMPEPPPEDELF